MPRDALRLSGAAQAAVMADRPVPEADAERMTPAQRRVWRTTTFGHPELTPAHKLVLLALETFADYPSGLNAYPGVSVLAEMCGLKSRAVEAALQAGRTLGLIECTGRANPKRGLAARYRLVSTRASVRIEDVSTRTSVRVQTDFQPARNDFQPARREVSTRMSVQPTNPETPIQDTKGGSGAPWPDEPRCERHSAMFNPPPCNACKQVRLAQQPVVDVDRAAIRAAIESCPDCDDYGRLDDLTFCPRHPNQKATA